MRMKYMFIVLLALAAVFSRADEVVYFQASSMVPNGTSLAQTAEDFPLDVNTPTVTTGTSGYTGPDVYGGLNERHVGHWAVGDNNGSGLRVRMNDSSGNGVDGLFLFAVPGVGFDAENDTLNVAAINISQQQRLANATIRFVVEDAGSFYISEPSANLITGGSGALDTSFSLEALSANWFEYDPFAMSAAPWTNNTIGVSTIGAAAAPGFNDIDFIGFTLFADGPESGGGGVNFGVRRFSATAVLQNLAVDFDGSQISSSSTWDSAMKTLDLDSGYNPENYSGQTIYHGYERDSTGASQVGYIHDGAAGGSGAVRIQWNSTTGWTNGDVSTAVFVFGKDEFLNGLDAGPVKIDADNDTLFAQVDYNSPSGALASGSLRWVVEDQGGFYISEPTAISADTTVSAEVLDLSWFDYDPTNDVAAVGSAAVPAFSDIGYIGFQLEAVCGTYAGQVYHRIGVEQFFATAMVDSGLTTYERWAYLFGGTNVIGSADNDYDGDNVSNLGEYAINGNPTNSGDKGQTSISNDGAYFTYVYAKRDGDSSLVYRLLDTANLLSGGVNTNGYASRSEGPVEGDYLMVTNNYNMTTDGLFVELEVEQQ